MRAMRCVPPAPGKQTDLDFGQAEPRLVVFGGDAVMAGQRQLEAAAHRGAVDRRDPRLAAGLDAASELRQFAAFLEQPFVRRLLALRLAQVPRRCGLLSSIVRSAPAQNASLPEVITAPLMAASVATFSTIADSSSITFVSMTFIERPACSR